ncbi:hypothetical protein Slin14017_G016410 [Septoria linicola]|nr:hypothetical protein Slin14017_G016410 [Septoria linicola]
MFALPQATTSAVRPARDGDMNTPQKSNSRRTSFFGSSGRPSAFSPNDVPLTPGMRPSGDTDFSATLVGSSSDDSSIRDGGDPLFSPQFSISSSRSPSLARQQLEEGIKKKKSFVGGFSLRSRKSSSALSRTVSTETWQTMASGDSITSARFGPAISTPSSSLGFFTRKRAKSSPKTPDERTLHSPKSMSSFMSTDSVTTIATVSPLGRSPHLPTPLRYSSTPDASENPPLDSDEPFPGILPSNRPVQTPRLAPRQDYGHRSFSSPATPSALHRPREPQSTTSQWCTNHNGHKIPYVVSGQAAADLEWSQSAGLAKSKDDLALEWAQYCEMVKHELRKQEKKEARDPLGVPPQDGTSKEMDAYATKKRGRTDDKIKIAAKFINRTSTCGLMLKEGWQESFPQELSVYQTLAEWEKHHAKRDPQMKETVLKRLFKKVKQELSTPLLADPERTPTVPALSRRRGEDKFLVDDASDTPLASSPDEEHYQVHGLGISTLSSMGSFDSVSADLRTPGISFQDDAQDDATPTLPVKSPLRYTSDFYFTSPTIPLSPVPGSLSREDKSGWETIADDEVDIDDDLIAAANGAGSTPDLRQKFRDEEFEDLLRAPVPPVPQISPEIRQKYEQTALPVRPSVPRHSSVLFVRRDSSRDKFCPKLNSEEVQAEFDRGVQAAAQRRIDKMSKASLATGHPALHINTSLSINPRSSSLPLHVPKARVSELPTPTKAKPVKPVKPPGLAAHLALRKLQEEESPPANTSYIPRPPRYGLRISPGKTLDSPKASDGVGDLDAAAPLPLPNRFAPSTETRRFDHASTAVQPIQDECQDPESPGNQEMNNVVAAWRGPRTPSMPAVHDYENSPSMQDAQRMRQRLGLPLLEHKRESDPPHPNHKYVWNTMNLMCMGIHRGAYEPTDASPSQDTLYGTSPLRGFGSSPTDSAVRLASYNTFNSISFNYEGKSCHACQRTCCYYAEQLAIMNMGFVQNPGVRAAVDRARRHEQELRREFPSGVERYDAHMKCSDCGAVCCFEHGIVCKTLSCRAALCDGCADAMGGRCRSHRDREESKLRQIEEVGLRMDRAVHHFQSLHDLEDEAATEELIDGLL